MQNNISKAFSALRKAGYFARQNWKCCQNCGWSAIPEGQEKVVFYHNQDYNRYKKGENFYLAWSGDGKEICNILEVNGVTYAWDGREDKRIEITNY
jgi:hypothetical protein